ncbi:MAG: hypothetical protein M5R37_02135 [Melioribacteraceae bacterium]|nr:hypothetical protein [Melioribacteraceae bacterium]
MKLLVKKENNYWNDLIILRNLIFKVIREELNDIGCLEVSTPSLCPFPDIAPMYQYTVTDHQVTSRSIYLKIAPTEYLKRFLIKGIERVFEFSTNFRPENGDKTHLAEFTSLEVMIKNYTFRDMQNLIERLYRKVLFVFNEFNGRFSNILDYRKLEIIKQPWQKVSLPDWLENEYSFSRSELFKQDAVLKLYNKIMGANYNGDYIKAIDDIVTYIATTYNCPVFIENYPYYLGGPAKLSNGDNRFKERCELFLGPLELANMSSNLVDVVAIKKWYNELTLDEQNEKFRPNTIDTTLMEYFEIGLPESAVFGLGIERLLMALLIKDDIKYTRPFSYNELFWEKTR